jgi:signal transduction histidine kinase
MMPSPFFAVVPDFQHLFESVPGLYLVLSSETPYEIVAVSNSYLCATMTKREEILRHSLFDVFPDNPSELGATGVHNVRASIEAVIRTGKPDIMPLQKYDIRRPQAEGHGFEERYWSSINSPIYSPNGKLRYIMNHVQDMTESVRLKQSGKQQPGFSAPSALLTEHSNSALLSCRQEIQEVNRRLMAADAAQLASKNSQLVKQTEQLNKANYSLRQLTARLLQIRDEERRRIARDLHDSIGQMLAAQGMYLFSVAAEAKHLSTAAAKALADSTALIEQMSGELRTISYLLHPPLLDEAGLSSALRWYAEGFAERSKIKISLELTPGLGRLSDEFEIAIFRIVQECLTNIHRHSGSPTASIRLAVSPAEIMLEIRDAGKGIPRQKRSRLAAGSLHGVGIRGMRERIVQLGGRVEISSNGHGTAVIARLPLANNSYLRPGTT